MPTPHAAASIPIEAVSHETYDWKPQAPEMHSRAEVLRQTGPYDATVTAPILDWNPRIPGDVSANVEDATRSS